MKLIPYASVVESIMFFPLCRHPNLAFIIRLLVKFQSNQGLKHWQTTKKVLCYMQQTKHYMLVYKRTDNLEVIDYSYANFAGRAYSQRSTPDYVFTLVSRAISWRSCKHAITTSSTMFAKFISCYEVVGHAMWLKTLFTI
jgi:hypothetical protein